MPRSTLCDYVRSNWDPFLPTQSKLWPKPIIPLAPEEKLVEYILLIERKYFGCTRDDVRSLSVQFPVHNKTPSPFSVAKEAADTDRSKRCIKRHSDKLSLCQPTRPSTGTATGFSKQQAGICFDLRGNSLLLVITHLHLFSNWFNGGSKETTKNPRTRSQKPHCRCNSNSSNYNCRVHQCQWNLVGSPNFTVQMLHYCYLHSLFLNIPQSCLQTHTNTHTHTHTE